MCIYQNFHRDVTYIIYTHCIIQTKCTIHTHSLDVETPYFNEIKSLTDAWLD